MVSTATKEQTTRRRNNQQRFIERRKARSIHCEMSPPSPPRTPLAIVLLTVQSTSQAKVQDLATQVQHLQQEVNALELEKKHSAAQVQALNEYVSKSCRHTSAPEQQDDAVDKQGRPAFTPSAVRISMRFCTSA